MMQESKNYIQPASNTKGVQEVPGWRDPERALQNWKDCARYLGYYRKTAIVLIILPLIAIIWLAGYAKALLDGSPDCPPAVSRNERNQK